METAKPQKADLSAQIATAIRDAIVEGRMITGERLPSEAELAEQFNVSRPTVREALKRLAAQSLIRTQRGAFDAWTGVAARGGAGRAGRRRRVRAVDLPAGRTHSRARILSLAHRANGHHLDA